MVLALLLDIRGVGGSALRVHRFAVLVLVRLRARVLALAVGRMVGRVVGLHLFLVRGPPSAPTLKAALLVRVVIDTGILPSLSFPRDSYRIQVDARVRCDRYLARLTPAPTSRRLRNIVLLACRSSLSMSSL